MESFPHLGNSAVNKEVSLLRYYVKDYIYAIQSYNLVGRENAMQNIQKKYKKIQGLRKYLSPDDDDVVNRYLVRIKSTLFNIEGLKQQNLK